MNQYRFYNANCNNRDSDPDLGQRFGGFGLKVYRNGGWEWNGMVPATLLYSMYPLCIHKEHSR